MRKVREERMMGREVDSWLNDVSCRVRTLI